MDIDDIKDRESLEAWLKTRPREDAVAIAHRAALRVFPLFGRAMGEEWARERDFTALFVLRPALASGSVGMYLIPTATAAVASTQSASAFARSAAEFAAFAAFSAARFSHSTAPFSRAVDAVDAAVYANAAASSLFALSASQSSNPFDVAPAASAATASVAGSVSPVAYATTDYTAVWQEVRRDALLAMQGEDAVQFPLWADIPPDWFSQADRETRAIWAENPAHWEFWSRWWDAAIAGTPLDWDLQRDVALIPDDVWQQGPGPVAIEIARLEELHDLRRELTELKRRLTDPPPAVSVAAGAELRGHNNPPELLETNAELRKNLVVVWQALDEAETELAKRHPEPAALKRIATWLLTATKAIALYCAKLGDTAVKNAAAEFGKAGGKWLAGGAAFGIALNIQPIARFAERLLDFIK